MAVQIQFGTDGWRALIAREFTEDNVARVAAAHARYLRAQGGKRVVIGFDTRFGGARFARVAAGEFARRGLDVLLATEFLPTPALSFAVKHYGAAGGVMITASHNPPEYNGYKLKGPYGGSVTPSIARDVEGYIDAPDEPFGSEGRVESFDVRQAYYEALDRVLDVALLRTYQGELYHDSMGGAGSSWISEYARHANFEGLTVRPVRGEPHPMFHGVNPEPIPQNLELVSNLLAACQDPTFACVTDGDADRVGAVLAGGRVFNSHQIFAVLLKHLFDRGVRGRVVKTVSTSAIIDRLCEHLGLEVIETPVGFKYITDAFLEGEADERLAVLIGGEESGGLAVRGHIPERDGVLNSLLLLEAVAKSGKSLPALFADIERLTNFEHHYDRVDLHLDPAFDIKGAMRASLDWTDVAGQGVQEVVTKDGVKFVLQGGAFVMLRGSGTEPVLRVYVEAPSEDAVQVLLAEAVRRVHAFGTPNASSSSAGEDSTAPSPRA
ncbi:phosphoglucomutase/phosphomannomutase family protein [Deinococcus yavapaiensis]|uniref:Phosphomannomutase n=1 Tax=Deinococcus yavapaiensis KR-236 TaxID=694435 RepID=A0A318S9B4_9DEIO|nr:phosphoglucomutase/phosphomannomutase family protein [Deinococcus yavapaiensis]PYE55730.1 phosphomannomutase [Deinococcus yavapaiensis KR-236]